MQAGAWQSPPSAHPSRMLSYRRAAGARERGSTWPWAKMRPFRCSKGLRRLSQPSALCLLRSESAFFFQIADDGVWVAALARTCSFSVIIVLRFSGCRTYDRVALQPAEQRLAPNTGTTLYRVSHRADTSVDKITIAHLRFDVRNDDERTSFTSWFTNLAEALAFA